jgi:hypothetical protein
MIVHQAEAIILLRVQTRAFDEVRDCGERGSVAF